jgi:hypothetical protein
MLYNTDGKPIIEEKEIRTIWKINVTDLLHADRLKMEEEIIVEDHLAILIREEVAASKNPESTWT